MSLNGAVSGIGVFQNNAVSGNNGAEGAFSNAHDLLSEADWLVSVLRAGGRLRHRLAGVAFHLELNNQQRPLGPGSGGFREAPVRRRIPTSNVGILPTLIGAESTFDFQNMNIERGLLWNQENAINRGVQINQTMGKFTASLSYNDGFYSNRYNWLTGVADLHERPAQRGFCRLAATLDRQTGRTWPRPSKTTA